MRKFKNKSFEDSTGASRVKLKTCNCIIVYDKNGKYLDSEQKCKLHQQQEKQEWMNIVLTHHRTFSEMFGNSPNESQREQMYRDMDTEKKRIRKL